MLLHLYGISNYQLALITSYKIWNLMPSGHDPSKVFMLTVAQLTYMTDEEIKAILEKEKRLLSGEKRFFLKFIQYRKAMTALNDFLCLREAHIMFGIHSTTSNINPTIYPNVAAVYNDMVNFLKQLSQERKKDNIKIRKAKEEAKKRITILENVKEDQYLELTPDEMKYYPIDILEMLEFYMIQHNEKIYQNLQKELYKFNSNTHEQMKKILKQYGILMELDYKELIAIASNCDLDQLKEKLEYLKQVGVTLDKNLLIDYLQTTKMSDIKILKSYCIQNLITLDYFQENFVTFLQSIDLIQKNYEIMLTILGDKSKVGEGLNKLLLENSEQLANRLNLWLCYGMSFSENKEIFEYLMHPYFFDVIDIWIELGLFQELQNNWHIFSSNPVQISKRVVLAKRINLPLFDDQGKLRAEFFSNKYLVSDQELDDCLENVTSYLIEDMDKLNQTNREIITGLSCELDEQYKINNQTYKIGGILISRPKVMRNFEGNLKDAIFYGSIQTLEESEAIIEELNQRKALSLEKTVAKP